MIIKKNILISLYDTGLTTKEYKEKECTLERCQKCNFEVFQKRFCSHREDLLNKLVQRKAYIRVILMMATGKMKEEYQKELDELENSINEEYKKDITNVLSLESFYKNCLQWYTHAYTNATYGIMGRTTILVDKKEE